MGGVGTQVGGQWGAAGSVRWVRKAGSELHSQKSVRGRWAGTETTRKVRPRSSTELAAVQAGGNGGEGGGQRRRGQ